MINYNEVPSIISEKDLDYLSDMFDWNYGALKKINDFRDRASDQEIIDALKEGCRLFDRNLNIIQKTLGGQNE
ncbi:MAG: hypothetical protein PUD59_00650 [bacterium]|nr:hypothetical protein [bacterium]